MLIGFGCTNGVSLTPFFCLPSNPLHHHSYDLTPLCWHISSRAPVPAGTATCRAGENGRNTSRSCLSPSTNDFRPAHPENTTASSALSFSQRSIEKPPGNITTRLLSFLGSMLPAGDRDSWSDHAIDADYLGASTARSTTPSTERSNAPSDTTAESRTEQKCSSSGLWGWVGSNTVSGSGRVLQTERCDTDALKSGSAVSPRTPLTSDCKSLGRAQGAGFKEDLAHRRCAEIDLCSKRSDQASAHPKVPKGKSAYTHDGSKSTLDEHINLNPENNSATEDKYWKWDQDRQRFIHTDANTGRSVACPVGFD
ncbi:hypothetical protein QBC38DRAFT_4558 [Podospora fimiseda]|uniref:Uncharacterized protein n=1 Tax=Podospora fimiseda TaxID=252190 RepID=A0AAN7BZL4_9PEZI|nr:hypothetical protein QBC38DRAFT_4558 [Podospora fimiseda]